MVDDEKRILERFTLSAPALLEVAKDGAEMECMYLVTRDLCGGGAYFFSDNPLQTDTMVRVGIFLEIKKLQKLPLEGHVLVQANGSVLRAETNGMAVRFLSKCQVTPIDGPSPFSGKPMD